MCNAHDNDDNSLMLRGLHHDYLGELENKGELKLLNKKIDKHGVYRADAAIHGLLKLGASFFPQSWNREYVVSKVLEAYDNFVSLNPRIALQPNNLYQFQGATSEGI